MDAFGDNRINRIAGQQIDLSNDGYIADKAHCLKPALVPLEKENCRRVWVKVTVI